MASSASFWLRHCLRPRLESGCTNAGNTSLNEENVAEKKDSEAKIVSRVVLVTAL